MSLKVRLFITIFIITNVFFIIFYFVINKNLESLLLDKFLESKLRLTENISHSINPEEYKKLLDLSFEVVNTNAYCQSLRDYFYKLRNNDPFITFLYTINKNNNDELFYGISSQKVDDNLVWIESDKFITYISVKPDRTVKIGIDDKIFEKEVFINEIGAKLKVIGDNIYLGDKKIITILDYSNFTISVAGIKKVDYDYVNRLPEKMKEEIEVNNQKVLVYYSLSFVGEPYEFFNEKYVEKDFMISEILSVFKNKKSSFRKEFRKNNYGWSIATYAPVIDKYKNVVTVVVAEFNKKEFDEYKRIFFNVFKVLLVLFYLLLILIFVMFISFVSSNIRTIIEYFKIFFSKDLTRSIEYKGVKEINKIISNFKEFRELLINIIMEIRNTTIKLKDHGINLKNLSDKINTFSNEQSQSARILVQKIEDYEKMTESIKKIINDVSKDSTSTKYIVKDGEKLVIKNRQMVENIKNNSDKTMEGVKQLSKYLESIWDVLNIILSIADQTKIIAFNAELEAASAGENGKNFEIVATEIRRLVDITMSSTSEIKKIINEIQSSANYIIEITKQGNNIIDEELKISFDMENIFKNILKMTDNTANSSLKIEQMANDQVKSLEDNIQSIKSISEEIAYFITLSNELKNISSSIDNVIDQLNKQISEFKL